jgi:hypothetical protein
VYVINKKQIIVFDGTNGAEIAALAPNRDVGVYVAIAHDSETVTFEFQDATEGPYPTEVLEVGGAIDINVDWETQTTHVNGLLNTAALVEFEYFEYVPAGDPGTPTASPVLSRLDQIGQLIEAQMARAKAGDDSANETIIDLMREEREYLALLPA